MNAPSVSWTDVSLVYFRFPYLIVLCTKGKLFLSDEVENPFGSSVPRGLRTQVSCESTIFRSLLGTTPRLYTLKTRLLPACRCNRYMLRPGCSFATRPPRYRWPHQLVSYQRSLLSVLSCEVLSVPGVGGDVAYARNRPSSDPVQRSLSRALKLHRKRPLRLSPPRKHASNDC